MNQTVTFCADPDDEAFVLDQHFDIAIPVCFLETEADGLYVECYPQVEPLLREHVARYRDRLFSDAALRALHEALAPYARRWGYTDDCHRMRRYSVYTASADTAVDTAGITDGTRRLTAADQAHNRTTINIAELCREGCLVTGVVEQGEVVSVAATHVTDGDWPPLVEVTVETAVSARRRGFAVSALLALRRELALAGHGMEYRCSCRNVGSARAARRAGLVCSGKCYYYVLRYDRRAARAARQTQ